ncbi:hypothetical protein [Larkinella soli]|uniref:hypothetical protein n=1 Tax=Larkinella soli TaxID=1770527 RepID=UPI000FFB3DA3|nr:hypothetical protein [Larkinella soli]
MLWITLIVAAVVFLLVTLVVFRPALRRSCPTCHHDTHLERVKRPGYLKTLLFWLPNKAYRCYACNRNFLHIG